MRVSARLQTRAVHRGDARRCMAVESGGGGDGGMWNMSPHCVNNGFSQNYFRLNAGLLHFLRLATVGLRTFPIWCWFAASFIPFAPSPSKKLRRRPCDGVMALARLTKNRHSRRHDASPHFTFLSRAGAPWFRAIPDGPFISFFSQNNRFQTRALVSDSTQCYKCSIYFTT